MKKSKKIMMAPLMVGVLAGASGCSFSDVNINKESMNQILDTVDKYMDENNAYSSEYAKDSLMTLLNEGIFEITSKQYVNYEMTEKIKANDSFGNRAHATEPYCIYAEGYVTYMECFQPYLNIKAYYDETNSTLKYYEKSAIYDNLSGEVKYVFSEKYIFVANDENPSYIKTTYDVENKTKQTVESNREDELEFDYSIRPLDYYNKIYKQVNLDDTFISFNKVDDTTVEYTINDYKNNVVTKCKFVNGMLEKYVLASFNAGYGEPTHHGIVETEIKYSSEDISVPEANTYTDITE